MPRLERLTDFDRGTARAGPREPQTCACLLDGLRALREHFDALGYPEDSADPSQIVRDRGRTGAVA